MENESQVCGASCLCEMGPGWTSEESYFRELEADSSASEAKEAKERDSFVWGGEKC